MPDRTTSLEVDVAQAVQVVGALLVLLAFVLAQFRVWRTDALPYRWANLLGAGILAVLAALQRQWGFLLLEGVWALVSAWSLMRPGRPGGAPAGAAQTGSSDSRQNGETGPTPAPNG